MADNIPVIQFASEGEAAVLNYNVPESTTYAGRNLIDLGIPNGWFTKAAWDTGQDEEAEESSPNTSWSGVVGDLGGLPPVTLGNSLVRVLDKSLLKPFTAPSVPEVEGKITYPMKAIEVIGPETTIEWHWPATDQYEVVAGRSVVADLKNLSPTTFVTRVATGLQPIVKRTTAGEVYLAWATVPTEAEPTLLLVEEYRLSSYLGDYGAGRTLKTFSLLPGESTTISMSTFRSETETATQSSSIFDSYTSTSETEFISTVESENSSTESVEKAKSYHADAEAKASWGWGSASVSGGVDGSTNSAREESARCVTSATDKHAQSASAQRDIQVETSIQTTAITETETAITREIKNINVGRTLNFAFRQLNQEFFTVLHLVNVRVAFFNGFTATKVEVPLHELDSLLATYILPRHRSTVREFILKELGNVIDHAGTARSLVEEAELKNAKDEIVARYLRVPPNLESTFKSFTIPGVIIRTTQNVMRTEGVIVEALLGQASALDDYTASLQAEAVREKSLANDYSAARNAFLATAAGIVSDKNADAAAIFASLMAAFDTTDTETEES